MQIIKVENLTKNYDYYSKEQGLRNSFKNIFGRKKLVKEAVKSISFGVEAGEIVGFIGPNGAGKTTTLKMLSGILVPTSGKAVVNNYTPWERKKQFKMNFSIVMGQKTQLNFDLPALETFYLNKHIYEIPDNAFKQTLDELLELLNVGDLAKKQVRRLSLGERMKMEFIAALLHKPKVLLLDEPTIGLDLVSQKSIREFIRYYNQKTGATILLTSHYMGDIESLCKRAIIINEGNIVYDGSLSDISADTGLVKILKIRLEKTVQKSELSRLGVVREYDDSSVTLEVPRDILKETSKAILEELPVLDFTIEDVPIEDAISLIYAKGGDV
ncbi:MAG: ATP-binding cassette domain-containing protein [Oscillospiraceae bacterium]|nr:ATP-binding cassette domain-containing protein [Oscillospiraceae bacterium]